MFLLGFLQVEEINPGYSKLNYVFLAKVRSRYSFVITVCSRILSGHNPVLLFFHSATKTWAKGRRPGTCAKQLVQ